MGMITGVSPGYAWVYATTHDGGYSASTYVSVASASVPVTGVSLNLTATTIAIGGSQILYAYITPSNATNTNVIWNSSSPAIATVSSGGVVYGLAAGQANITVMTADGGYLATCVVTVGAGGGTIGVVVQ
jgi:uncharacterized protein YjdB